MSNIKYSIGHPESLNGTTNNGFFNALMNSYSDTIDDISDVYFGKFFRYEYGGSQKSYGNCMGVEATDAQIDNLFELQNMLGIQISLTMNQTNIPSELHLDKDILDSFIEFIKSFYDRGLRSCTISNVHLMKTGILHRAFPEMRWKNTVNHKVSDAQQLVDMFYCGYDTIQVDRSLNRNIAELKKMRVAADKLIVDFPSRKKLLLSMLIVEYCLYNCPFKTEHDHLGAKLGAEYFVNLGNISCNNWRFGIASDLPRSGINLITTTEDTFESFSGLVDVFKTSGRFAQLKENDTLAWVAYGNGVPVVASSLSEAIKFGGFALHEWNLIIVSEESINSSTVVTSELGRNMESDSSIFWKSKKGKELEKTLMSCKSQCWDCHKCEDAFNLPHMLSLLPEHIS